MPIFLWNPISISLLSQLILAVVIACYFAWNVWSEWKRDVSRSLTAWLFVGFLSFSLFLLCGFLKAVLHPDFQAFVLPWASIPGAVAIISVCALAYRFSSYWRRTNSIIQLAFCPPPCGKIFSSHRRYR